MFSKLKTTQIDKYKWKLDEDLSFTLAGPDGNSISYIAPKGTITDGYSIPRWLWFILSPDCLSIEPAIIHDLMCSNKWLDSKLTHAIFYHNVKNLKAPRWKKAIIGYGVILFGPKF